MEHWIFEFDIKVPWEPKMLIGRLCHASNYSFFRCQSNGAWKWGCQRPVPEVFPLLLRRSESEKRLAASVLPPLKKEKKNGKLKHHILPFTGSADHIPVHSSLIPAHFSIFRCHSGSFRYIPVPLAAVPLDLFPTGKCGHREVFYTENS